MVQVLVDVIDLGGGWEGIGRTAAWDMGMNGRRKVVSRDPREVGQSRAVEGVRTALGFGGGGGSGGRGGGGGHNCDVNGVELRM